MKTLNLITPAKSPLPCKVTFIASSMDILGRGAFSAYYNKEGDRGPERGSDLAQGTYLFEPRLRFLTFQTPFTTDPTFSGLTSVPSDVAISSFDKPSLNS